MRAVSLIERSPGGAGSAACRINVSMEESYCRNASTESSACVPLLLRLLTASADESRRCASTTSEGD